MKKPERFCDRARSRNLASATTGLPFAIRIRSSRATELTTPPATRLGETLDSQGSDGGIEDELAVFCS